MGLRITFILEAYAAHPSGGPRIVYQYANYLALLGHSVVVVHPWQTRRKAAVTGFDAWPASRLTRAGVRLIRTWHPPRITWQSIDPAVRLLWLRGEPNSKSVPDADVVFATGWSTVEHVLELAPSKGVPFYLIQHYETWSGPQALVDGTWRSGLHKVVISNWLYALGKKLGAPNLRHIPNAIDHGVFRVLNDPLQRGPGVASMYAVASFKGTSDAMWVLHAIHAIHPNVPVTLFGAGRRGPDVPDWVVYHQDPTQNMLVSDVYNASSIYLSASLSEGWALPPAEAMACGCAFVGTDIGGFADYAKDGFNALLSPPADREALLRNLRRAIEDQDLRHQLQARGEQSIRQFTWERSGAEMERYILEVLGLKRRAESDSRED